MSERKPFYKKPLRFSIVSRGLNHKLNLYLNPSDILHPNIKLNGSYVEGQLVLSPMHRGEVQTTHVQLELINNGVFVNYNEDSPNIIRLSLFEFTSIFTGLFQLGNLGGVIPEKKKTKTTRVKNLGLLPKVNNGNIDIGQVIRYKEENYIDGKGRQRTRYVPFHETIEPIQNQGNVFTYLVVDGKVRKKYHRSLILDTESAYDQVTIKRKNSSFEYFFQMLWLVDRIKRIEKRAIK